MTNGTEEWERKRILDLADEDMRKTVPALLTDIRLAATKGLGPEGAPNTMTLYRHAALLAVLSGQADVQTRRIVRLTWALVIFTAVLLLFTAYLCQDAYFKAKRDNAPSRNQSQPKKSNG
jgi:hypothetical protein